MRLGFSYMNLPGFNGLYGWISINEFDLIYGERGSFESLGFQLHDELTSDDGTIFVLLEKKISTIAL